MWSRCRESFDTLNMKGSGLVFAEFLDLAVMSTSVDKHIFIDFGVLEDKTGKIKSGGLKILPPQLS